MKTCTLCGRTLPQVDGRLICSVCERPIAKGHKWRHGGDGRARHKDCDNPTLKTEEIEAEVRLIGNIAAHRTTL